MPKSENSNALRLFADRVFQLDTIVWNTSKFATLYCIIYLQHGDGDY